MICAYKQYKRGIIENRFPVDFVDIKLKDKNEDMFITELYFSVLFSFSIIAI